MAKLIVPEKAVRWITTDPITNRKRQSKFHLFKPGYENQTVCNLIFWTNPEQDETCIVHRVLRRLILSISAKSVLVH